jgi:hypothetical protein
MSPQDAVAKNREAMPTDGGRRDADTRAAAPPPTDTEQTDA